VGFEPTVRFPVHTLSRNACTKAISANVAELLHIAVLRSRSFRSFSRSYPVKRAPKGHQLTESQRVALPLADQH
jgi:hypothetical protein